MGDPGAGEVGGGSEHRAQLGQKWVRLCAEESRAAHIPEPDLVNREEMHNRLWGEKMGLVREVTKPFEDVLGKQEIQGEYAHFKPKYTDANVRRDLDASETLVKHAEDTIRRVMPNIDQVGARNLAGVEQIVKIHLMPIGAELLDVLERLAKLYQESAAMRNVVGEFKVRILKNNADDLPEFVLRVPKDRRDFVVDALKKRLKGVRGSRRVPRYNREVEGGEGLIYEAVGDGDLKAELARLGVIDKVFDSATNYSTLRPDLVAGKR